MPDTSDLAEMVEMALRIVLSDDMQLARYAAPPTLVEIEAFRIHVIRLRLRGVLRQELCEKLLDRAEQRLAAIRRPPHELHE